MIDTLKRLLPQTKGVGRRAQGEASKNYALVTLHRPSNVDDSEMLVSIMRTLQRLSEKLTVIFPVHPRTRQRLQDAQFAIPNCISSILLAMLSS